MAWLFLQAIIGGDDADLVDHRPRIWREPLPDRLDVADRVQEPVRLGEDGVLLILQGFVGSRDRIEVIRDVVERDPRLVVPMIEEVLKEVRMFSGDGQRDADKLYL